MEPEQSGETANTLTGETDATAASPLSLVIFRLGTRWYALRTAVVREVAEMCTVRSIPRRSSTTLLGMVNLRGSLHLCISLAGLFGTNGEGVCTRSENAGKTARLVMIEKEKERWVFPVDEVAGVFQFLPGEIQTMSTSSTEEATLPLTNVITCLGKQVNYLDEGVLFDTLKRRIS